MPQSSPQETSPQKSGQLQAQIASLQAHLTQVEQKMLAQESSGFERLDRQLTQLAQQLAQLQVAVSFQSTPIVPQTPTSVAQPQSLPPNEAEHKPQYEAEHKPERVQPPTENEISLKESDPVLQRLSSLLDDF